MYHIQFFSRVNRAAHFFGGLFIALHPFLYLAFFWTPFRRVAIDLLFRVFNRIIWLFSKGFFLNPQPVTSMFDEFQQGVRDLAKRPALSAMLGFRMIYYVFPFILSLPFFFALRHRRG